MPDKQSQCTHLFHGLRTGQFAPYVDQLSDRASQGESAAASALGYIYFRGGDGVHKDYAAARCWFEKAKLEDDVTGFAAMYLATIYYKGLGVTKDHSKATKYLRSASLHGHANSRVMLAILHKKGDGTKTRSAETILRSAVCDSNLSAWMRFSALLWLSPLTMPIRV